MKAYFFFPIFLLINFNILAQLTLTDSLVAYYPFFGDASDHSGNGNIATVFGARPVSDRFGNDSLAFEFDGIDDYINTTTIFDYEYRSISVWAKPYNTQGNGFNEKHILGQDDNSLNYGQVQAKFSNGFIEMRAGGEQNHQINPIIDSLWYHIVLVRNGDTCEYYINNVLVGKAQSGTLASSITPYPNLVIGTGRTRTNQFYTGVIDDIRIYNRALNYQEVDSLYNEANPIISAVEDNLKKERFKVFPVPSKDYIYLESDLVPLRLEFLNSQGRVIKKFSPAKKYPIFNLPEGVYFIKIYSRQRIFIRKFVVNK